MELRYKTLDEATKALLFYAPTTRPKSYDLTTVKSLMAAVGNPEVGLRIIHVAGTSGKTSTCYYLRGLLEAAGCKTGLTVSPHISAINERVQISGAPLSSDTFLAYFDTYMKLVSTSGLTPSYYELLMAFAYYVFAQEKVDYAIIETGLGGLLDGSNVAEREDKICVIQRIGYDHTEILGNTLQEIALQKAGIIHEKNTVFVLEQSDEIDSVIADYAEAKHAVLRRVHESHVEGLPVSYQQANWAMAYAVYNYLVEQDGIQAIAEVDLATIKQQTPPGRYETYTYKDKTVIFDGAHNGQKLSALMDSMSQEGVDSPLIVLSLKETDKKKIEECMAAVAGHCQELVITTFNAGQDSRNITNTDTNLMHEIASRLGVTATVIENQSDALEYAVKHASKVVLVTGSLYLVSEMRRLIVS